MDFRSMVTSVIAFITVLSLAGCGLNRAPIGPGVVAPEAQSESAPNAALESSWSPDFEPDDFVRRVDHPYFPLTPGTLYTYEKRNDEGLEVSKFQVTRDVKPILGVRTTVVHDRAFLNGSLIEETFDWFAQDEDGNVWYLGEDSKAYENGKVVSTAGSWEAGKNGAQAGIIMLAHPRPGREYAQEIAPRVAEDRARVMSRSKTVSVPFGRFSRCVQTLETTPLDPAARDYKYYARGVGLVLSVSADGGDRFELKSVTRE